MAVFGQPVAEVVGKGTAEPGAKLRSGPAVEFGEGCRERCGRRIGGAAHGHLQCSKEF